MKTFWFYANIVSLVCTLLVVAIGSILLFQPSYLSYPDPVFRVVNKTVRVGEAVSIVISRCNSDSVRHNYIVGHSLICTDGRSPRILKSDPVMIMPGCSLNEKSDIHIVPRNTEPGLCRIVGSSTTQVLIRTVEVPWSSEEFEVVK